MEDSMHIQREKGSGEHYALMGRGDRNIPCFEGKSGQEVIMLGGKRGLRDIKL
jgi:hypothetical protein